MAEHNFTIVIIVTQPNVKIKKINTKRLITMRFDIFGRLKNTHTQRILFSFIFRNYHVNRLDNINPTT